MKKILYSLIIAAGLLSSCSDYLDVNTDPNNPSDVEIDLIMPAAQANLAVTLGGYLAVYSGYFAQYYEQSLGANSYNTLTIYSFGTTQFDGVYTDMYAEALTDFEQIRIKAEAEEDWGNYFAATVLRCYAFQIIADIFGDAPYSEALQGADNATPVWDAGYDIYDGLLAELDAAEALMENPSDYSIGAGYFLVGDASAWVKFANALRLKILMRGSYYYEANGDTDKIAAIKALVEENNFPTADIEFDAFEATDNKRNPIYEAYDSSSPSLVATYPIASMDLCYQEPRAHAMFEWSEDTNGTPRGLLFGLIPGSKTYAGRNQTEYNEDQELQSFVNLVYNDYIETETRPIMIMAKFETEFFKSEAYLRFLSDDDKAKASYEAAVDASFAMYSNLEKTSDSVYGAGGYDVWPTSGEEAKLKVIGRQKWVALGLVNNFESWCEVRRMGYPALTTIESSALVFSEDQVYPGYTAGDMIEPVMNNLVNSKYIRRAYYPLASSSLNSNTPANNTGASSTLGTCVWWDTDRINGSK